MKSLWFFFVLLVIIIVSLFYSFNSPRKIYIDADNVTIAKLIDYLSSQGIRYRLVNKDEANYFVNFEKFEVSTGEGLVFNLKWDNNTVTKILSALDLSTCTVLNVNNKYYLPNSEFYEHFTISLSCGINIMILPAPLERLDLYIFRVISDIISGNYGSFENGFLVTNMYVYKLSDEVKLVGIYNPILDVFTEVQSEKNY
ncbi:hypothetical protein JYK00_06495 [Thermosipho ferrireducens]|uniref:Uncharacterized protein n=1 Tax=Thermosipho ferrireducens TaxID=2571116 RepID=A0ABX7S6J3_9BACT|nr:hypothetical protein [Thermosipho ferrireducens]QTA37385.1 hypothetical protein JYK00_06495 [Thermosipho ferrireducens]